MAQARTVQNDFTSGELSPRLLGRTDLDRYERGVLSLENFIVQKHGGIHTRPGTKHIARTKTAADTVRLIPFQFSTTQAYMLELGDLYMRVYRDLGQLVQVAGDPSPGTITEIVTPWTSAQLADLKWAQSADTLYVCHPDVQARTIKRLAGNDTDPATWSVATFFGNDGPYSTINTTSTTLSPDGVTGTVTITASAAVFASTDVGRLVRILHGNIYGNATITAFGSSTSVTATVNRNFGGTGTSLDWLLGAWSETTGWPWVPLFHEQRVFFAGTNEQPNAIHSSETGRITRFRPNEPVDQIVLATSAISNIIDDDQLNAIRDLKSDKAGIIVITEGGPFVASGGSQNEPMTPNNFYTRRQGVTPADERVRTVQVGTRTLFWELGAEKLRQFAFNFDEDRFISTDLTVLSEHITAGGITEAAFQLRPDSTLWCTRADGTLVGFTYEPDHQVIAWHRHETGGRLIGSSKPKFESVGVIPDRTLKRDFVYLVTARTIDGAEVRSVEYMTQPFGEGDDQELDAFYLDAGATRDDRKTITAATNANPVKLTVTAHGFSDGDEVRVRAVLGMTEINDRTFVIDHSDANNFELLGEDGTGHGIYEAGTGTAAVEITTVTGLDHLEGETVGVYADGAIEQDATVLSGAITLEDGASIIHVGLRRSGECLLLPLALQRPFDAEGHLAQVNKMILRLHNSLGGEVGIDDDGGEFFPIIYRETADPMDTKVPLFSGSEEVGVLTSMDRDSRVMIRQTEPTPLTVLQAISQIEVGGA